MTINDAQLTEDDDHILVAILDETYGHGDSDEEWDLAREAFRKALEAEFGLSFEDADIGPGASFPAFAAMIGPVVTVATAGIAIVIAGKPIREGLNAWLAMAVDLRKFFTRKVYLNRNGAAVLAIGAVAKEAGQLPTSVQLLGYQPQHVLEPHDLASQDRLTEIAAAPGTIYLGALRHVFEIDADGAVFRVSVEGKTVRTYRLPSQSK